MNTLSAPEKGLVIRLPRQPGQKEARYAHLLSGDIAAEPPPPAPVAAPPASGADKNDRMVALEAATEELRKELADVRRQVEEFRKQFE